MSKEKTGKGNKSIFNTIWMIIFIVLAVGSIIINNSSKLQLCLVDKVELQDYYMNFLWPALYGDINLLYTIIVVVCGIIYFGASNDVSVGLGDKSVIHIKNMSIVITAVTGGIYGAVGILCFKTVSIITVVIGLMIIFTVISVITNIIEYKHLSEDGSVLEVFVPVIKRFLVILIAMVISSMLLLKNLPREKKETDDYYDKLYDELVEVAFGHEVGVETNRALLKYVFVRMYGDSGREYDLEKLKEEYELGEGSWSNLWYFCHDSADIELASQQIDIYTEFYPYYETPMRAFDRDEILYKYYDISGKTSEERWNAVEDKLCDLQFFCVCVEEELNKKGLTLRQEGDSSEEKFENTVSESGYQTATKEDILVACESFAANVEPIDGSQIEPEYVDSLDISMELNMDKPWHQSTVTEKNGYVIDGYYMSVLTSEKTNQFAPMLSTDSIKTNEKYKVSLYFNLPTSCQVAENIDVNIDGVNAYYVKVDSDEYTRNRVKVSFLFTTSVHKNNSVDDIEIGYNHIRPWYTIYDATPVDINPICTIESMEWSVYDVKTGELKPYAEDTFSENNRCYVATIKIVPDADKIFDNVGSVKLINSYFGDIIVPEYDEKQHTYTAGSYPKAYYEKHLEDDQDYIMLYLPYYQAETKANNGDLYSLYSINTMEEENFIYVIEGSKVRLEESSNTGLEVEKYKVEKSDGTSVSSDEVNIFNDPERYSNEPSFIMPAYPIVVIGYY